jgi:hypothetical protein
MLVIKLKKAVIALAGGLIILKQFCSKSQNKRIKRDYSRSGSSFLSNVIKGIIAKAEEEGLLVIILQSNDL